MTSKSQREGTFAQSHVLESKLTDQMHTKELQANAMSKTCTKTGLDMSKVCHVRCQEMHSIVYAASCNKPDGSTINAPTHANEFATRCSTFTPTCLYSTDLLYYSAGIHSAKVIAVRIIVHPLVRHIAGLANLYCLQDTALLMQGTLRLPESIGSACCCLSREPLHAHWSKACG